MQPAFRVVHRLIPAFCVALSACAADTAPISQIGSPSDGSADAGGATGGASNGDLPTGGGDGPQICESILLRAEPLEPDMLVVLDRSLSMVNTGNTGFPRWPASVSGIKSVTAELDHTIRFGLMVFPGVKEEPCSAGAIKVELGLDHAPDIASALDDTAPTGQTPTAATLRAAHEALVYDRGQPDVVPRNKYVLLVTDGAPTCNPDPANGITSGPDEENTYAAVSELAADNILTYVVGYDTRDSPYAVALDEMARRGATGDTSHRAVEDEATLVAELERIANNAVSCTYALDKKPGDPRYVRVEVDGTTYPLGDGWELTNDTTITLMSACDALRDGKPHVLEITVECDPVVVI